MYHNGRMYRTDKVLTKDASKAAAEIKSKAIEQFRRGSTAALTDLKSLAGALEPHELAGKMPSNWLPRTLEAAKRGVGKVGAAIGLIGTGIAGFFRNRARNRKLFDLELSKLAAYSIEQFSTEDAMTKSASALSEVEDIMRRVYEEDPSYWPYGLGVEGHDSVYLIRDNMTKAAAGFVGWQEQRINGRRVGSYSIGILPEHRSKGFAKEAVAKILMEKAAGVDEVRSYVCTHNTRSKGLANVLGIKIQEKF